MPEPSDERDRPDTARAMPLTIMFVGAILVLPVVGVFAYIRHEISGGGTPSCDQDAVEVEWVERDGLWRRSDAFELDEAPQTVQVDVRLQRDGGVLQFGSTVFAVPAGEPTPVPRDMASSTTRPYAGMLVGRGVDAVNEQIELARGRWELIVDGTATATELRWPC